MADNYLITGYWGEPHVTVENDRGINAAIFGTGRFVLPVGQQFRAEYIGNNTVRMYDGKLLDNGAAAGIPTGRYIDLTIAEAGQGKKRNDLIVFQYSRSGTTLVETGSFIVIKGTETTDDATDPELTHQDLLSETADLDQFALWRVTVSGTVISDPVKVFSVSKNMKNTGQMIVPANTEDSINYTATVDGLEGLYDGLEITIIPNMANMELYAYLDVNGFGKGLIKQPLTTSLSARQNLVGLSLSANTPTKLRYEASTKTWLAVEALVVDASTVKNQVSVRNGGTGLAELEEGSYLVGNGKDQVLFRTPEEVREDIGAAPAYSYGTEDLVPGVTPLETGKLYFVYE